MSPAAIIWATWGIALAATLAHVSSEHVKRENEKTSHQISWRDKLSYALRRDELEHVRSADTGLEQTAADWLETYNEQMLTKSFLVSEATWNYETNITDENAKKMERVLVDCEVLSRDLVTKAKKFYGNVNSFRNETVRRMLKLIVEGSTQPISSNDTIIEQLESTLTTMEGIYGKATVEKDGRVFALEPDLSALMAKSKDYDELLWAWLAWRDATGPLIRPLFVQAVDLMNTAARENGYEDVGESWRIADFDDKNIGRTMDTLMERVMPLYKQLHAYVRRKLITRYPDRGIDEQGTIPAHLFGNMWAQQWTHLIDLVRPYPHKTSFNLTKSLVANHYTPLEMVQAADGFFTSLGLNPMTSTFYEKSIIVKPTDRDFMCHASAHDFSAPDDYRIKMCTEVTSEYFQTIHHEIGHIQYYMLYSHQPQVFRNGANAAFHEAIGDTVALAVRTTTHLKAVNLLQKAINKKDESNEQGLNYLMEVALEKIAFLPFGYLLDKWRWDVFSGKISESDYNQKYWKYSERYQGIAPPVERTERDFDPGAKYHVPANVPYSRYFLSYFGQFQFYNALCEASGYQDAIYNCDFYRSKEAGNLLRSALSLGASKPWQQVMKILTGQENFTADPILEYFRPLHEWLLKQNADEHVGWETTSS